MLHYQRVQREDAEVVQVTCNKCGRCWLKSESHPDMTAIKNTYGYGSKKDGNKYVSHICEPCMDEFYATFVVRPQIVGMIEWGVEPPDPKRFIDDPPAGTTAAPVAPAVEDHEPQEEAS
jgi:hypothetical protein